ncbi:MAG: TRAM domain-containing protein, partial [Phascolarctobacterium sp.]|nr:TRAM domain-containing protein [Phascolarctobacterium sp.]
ESEVLFEQPYDNEHIEGLISNYQRVIVKASVSLCGEIAKVKITGVQEDFLVGELI